MKYHIDRNTLYYSTDLSTLNNAKFYSKLDALNAVKGSDANIYFNWFPELWARYDYTKVSNKSYEQLKLERALTIREKYKYLKLYFSGGSDSITMLNSFIKNEIHIDEIVNWKRSLGSFKLIDPNIENERSAIPYLKSIQHLIPKTKITIKNIAPEDIEIYNRSLGANKENRRIIFGDPSELDLIPDHKYLYLKEDRDTVGIVEGGQKPSVFYYNNQWYFAMYDVNCTGFYNQAEDFFFDPANPELFIKTVHELKSHMDNLLHNDFEKFKHLIANRNNKEVRTELLKVCGREKVFSDVSLIKFHFNQNASPILRYNGKRIRYPYIRTFEVIRALIEQNQLTQSIENWNDNLTQLSEIYSSSIKFDKDHEPQPVIGFKPILSTLYNLQDRSDVISPNLDSIDHKVIVL